jgi:hypothetical protein
VIIVTAREIKPGRSLRVGVTGHRVPPKLPRESEAPLKALLDRIFATMVATAQTMESHSTSRSQGMTKFIVVSSLAEGADRIVAKAGLATGFKLQVVLPLSRDEYARDFETEASRADFAQLLQHASGVSDLKGSANERARAYEAGGLHMLANIDLLIAIWDGEEAAGVGGTAEIVNRALADGILVVWIQPTKPKALNVSWPAAGDAGSAGVQAQPKKNFRQADVAALAEAVVTILARDNSKQT